jgi:hypothetical protein
LHLLPVAGAVDDATAMAGACSWCIEMDELLLNLDCNQHWGWSSQLEATLLMAEDEVLLLSTWISFVVVSLMKGASCKGQGRCCC